MNSLSSTNALKFLQKKVACSFLYIVQLISRIMG